MEIAMAEAPAPPAKPSADDNSTPASTPSFLSALKASHEATKLYLQLIALVAGIPGVFLLVALRWGVPFWLASVVCVVPALLLLLSLVPAWRDRQNRRRAIAFGIRGQVKDPEYFRLTPYDQGSDFRRADKVHEAVYDWLVGNPAPLLYLSGASGSGKSSIICGWVLPKIVREGVLIHVVNARVVGNPIAVLTQALLRPGAIWERPPVDGKLALRDLLERAVKKVAPRKLLLVLDQFEEFLILADGEQRDTFTAVLRALAASPVSNLQLLMILRSDYRPLLDTLGLPEFEKDRKEVPPFFERDAMAFLRASELQISDTLESEIREEARDVEQTPGLIRPITVNLFGLVLRRFESLPKNYRKGTLLRSYLRELIQRKEIREFAPPILRSMMTGNGTKQPVTCAEVARTVGLDPDQVRGCLVQLANEGVVRELDRAHGKWEIAHDFIAGLYYQILAGWSTSVWRRARPWVITGGLGLWLVALLMLARDFQEIRNRQALTDLSFSSLPCDIFENLTSEPGCLIWAPVTTKNKITDSALPALIAHLKEVKMTRGLSLALTQVHNIDSLNGLTDLRLLVLTNTEVRNIDVLKRLTGLQQLYLGNTKIENIDALKRLTALNSLDLTGTQVRDINVLKELPRLRTLMLANTQVKNIDALEGEHGLRELDLSHTPVENVDALKALTGLTVLDLQGSHVQNIDVLKGLIRMERFGISGVSVESVDAIQGWTGLQWLILSNTPIRNVDALKRLNHLQHLDLSGTQVDTVNAIKGLTGLEWLDLGHTPVQNIDVLKGLTGLKHLEMNDTRIENIDVLKELTNLEYLRLANTRVQNVDALKGLTKLTSLDLSNTQVRSVDALKKLTSLSVLNLSGSRVQNADAEALRAALPKAQVFTYSDH
jgi:Leucine-rich repeat (LRR) protein